MGIRMKHENSISYNYTAMIRATDGNAINVMENDLMVELCAKFTEPAAVAGVLTLFTEMTGEAICKA